MNDCRCEQRKCKQGPVTATWDSVNTFPRKLKRHYKPMYMPTNRKSFETLLINVNNRMQNSLAMYVFQSLRLCQIYFILNCSPPALNCMSARRRRITNTPERSPSEPPPQEIERTPTLCVIEKFCSFREILNHPERRECAQYSKETFKDEYP